MRRRQHFTRSAQHVQAVTSRAKFKNIYSILRCILTKTALETPGPGMTVNLTHFWRQRRGFPVRDLFFGGIFTTKTIANIFEQSKISVEGRFWPFIDLAKLVGTCQLCDEDRSLMMADRFQLCAQWWSRVDLQRGKSLCKRILKRAETNFTFCRRLSSQS